MPQAKTKRHALRKAHPDIAALQRIRVHVVDALSLGVELVQEEVVVIDVRRARDRRVSIGGRECTTIGTELKLRCSRGARCRPQLHHARHRIRAVDRALGAAYHLKAFDIVHGKHAEIEETAGIIHRHAVHQRLVVAGFAAAHEQAGLAAAASAGVDDGSRDVAERLAGIGRIEQLELVATEHVERNRCLVHGVGRSGTRHHDGLRHGGELQLDVEGFGLRNGDLYRLLGESGSKDDCGINSIG